MPNSDELINLNQELGSMLEANEKLDTNTQILRELIIPDEVALALGDIERKKSPDEAFFLF